MKTKKQKNNPNNLDKILLLFSAGIAIISLVILLILLFFVLKTSYETKKNYNNSYYTNTKSVEITSDKNIYITGEKINLFIKNSKEQSVYFEPCEYLNNFEKKINGEWKRENIIVNDNNYYNQSSFNKNKSIAKCEISLPKSGDGIYRSVVRIYYNCVKPGHCENFEVFYSNEFEVKNTKEK